jgi:hypothetical protein
MKKSDLKGVAIVVVGVMAAGAIMWQLRDVGFVQIARNGYDT